MRLGVSYYGNRIPWRVKEDMQAIRDAGCTYVVHTFNEEDHEFYQPALEEIVRMTHELGMEAWLDPWGVGQVFGGETYSGLVMKQLPLRQVSSYGESLPIICPNQPGFRDYLLEWMDTAARLKADVLFWDEPHFQIYPEPDRSEAARLWACCCGECKARFQKRAGQVLPAQMTPEVRAFKEESLVDFIRFLCDSTRARGMRPALCLLPFESSSTVNDWAKAAAVESLEVIGTDPYWRPHQTGVGQHVGRFAGRVAELARQYRKEGQIWILNFNIPRGEEGKVKEAIEAAWAAGIRNLAAWSYFGASYITLRAEDPPAVWQTLSACYQELRRREK